MINEAVINYGNHLSSLVLGTLIVCMVKILYERNIVLSKDNTIDIGPFQFRYELFWLIPVGATILHVLLAYYFVEACNQIGTKSGQLATAKALSDGEPLLFGGLSSMKKIGELPILGEFYLISSWLTRTIFYSWLIILFASLFKRKNGSSIKSFLLKNSIAVIICGVNWSIGGYWATAASKLFN